MPPKTASPAARKRYCGLGNHHLRPPHKTISDEKILSFAKHINPELRINTLICGTCYDTLVKIYKVKLRHAIQLQRGKKASGNSNSISDVSSSQQQQLQNAQSQSSSAVSAYSTTSTSSSSTSSDNQPTTSTVKRKRNPDLNSGTDSGDDSPMLSLNAVNGTRLPNVQPIPKRRQFVHTNKNVMDVYLSGTTGG